jgi:hypothetical protein
MFKIYAKKKLDNTPFQTFVNKIVTRSLLKKNMGLPFAARASGRTCRTFINHRSLDG